MAAGLLLDAYEDLGVLPTKVCLHIILAAWAQHSLNSYVLPNSSKWLLRKQQAVFVSVLFSQSCMHGW